ncbi:MAG: STAS domain-containing protein [Bryobacteraceae bacterium]|nr:STAS domain-containing protein [Bryobacteraceae bacterium]
MSLSLTIRKSGEVTVVDASGRITLGEATGALRETVQTEAEKNTKILLNLADVSYIDSAGLGEMLGSYTSVRNRGGDLKLLNVQKKIHDLLQITRLYTIFETFEDEATAIASYSKSASA